MRSFLFCHIDLVTHVTDFPLLHRPRRLRKSAALRTLVRETVVSPNQCVLPLFITAETNTVRPVSSLPGHFQWSTDRLEAELDTLEAAGIHSVLLFGLPLSKDETGTQAWNAVGPVPRAAAVIRKHLPNALIIADVCLCEYTTHGHCGPLRARDGAVQNDETIALLGKAAVTYADAGVDVVAPSAMMDGQVHAIRSALNAAGHQDVPIMSYAAKYASAFYGPFREAAGSVPASGDRRGYQMDFANAREAMREVALDVAEGADILMVKPAGAYLDIIRAVRDRFDLPLAAYQVSGEFAMITAAAERGWLDEARAGMESLTAIKRAGADIIITYFAKQVAGWNAQLA